MRVLYLTTASAIGGGNRSLLTLWTGLIRQGVVPAVVCPESGAMVDESRRRGVTAHVRAYDPPSWRSPIGTIRQFAWWRALLAETRPDIVHTNDLAGARAIALAARAAGLPLVCHVRFPPGAEYTKWAFRALPKPAAFVLTSEAILKETTGYLAQTCPAARQVVIHNAVDIEQFQPRSSPHDGPPRIGIVANLSPIKRHQDFFAMARHLVDRGRWCEFWVVGEDISQSGYTDQLVHAVAELGLTDQVRFLGFQSDVASILKELDVVVSTSKYESFGRSLIEAMATGIPVVGSAVGGIPEILADGRSGVLVTPGDVKGFSNAVEKLLLDEQARAEMGRAGRARVLALFTLEAHATRMLALYNDLLSRGSAAAPSGVREH